MILHAFWKLNIDSGSCLRVNCRSQLLVICRVCSSQTRRITCSDHLTPITNLKIWFLTYWSQFSLTRLWSNKCLQDSKHSNVCCKKLSHIYFKNSHLCLRFIWNSIIWWLTRTQMQVRVWHHQVVMQTTINRTRATRLLIVVWRRWTYNLANRKNKRRYPNKLSILIRCLCQKNCLFWLTSKK